MHRGLLAYHITFGTYGTRLHGDERGAVDRTLNRPGDPIVGRNEHWQRIERARLNFPPVLLTHAERVCIESIVPSICLRGQWRHHASAAREDHVHALLTADSEGKAVRRWLKAWLGQALNDHFPGAIPRAEAAEPGSASHAEPGSASPVRAHSARLRDAHSARLRDAHSAPLTGARPTWWAECGSVKWIWDQAYFNNVFDYITRQRTSQ